MCSFCGDDAVEENLGGEHVSCWCAAVARVSDPVTANCESNAIRVFLLGSVVGNDASVGDVLTTLRRDFVVRSEDYSVGAFDSAGDTLGEATEFFSICIFPYGAVLWVFDEVAILEEFPSVGVEYG